MVVIVVAVLIARQGRQHVSNVLDHLIRGYAVEGRAAKSGDDAGWRALPILHREAIKCRVSTDEEERFRIESAIFL